MVYHYLQHEESISHVFKRTFNYESLFYRYLDPIIPSQVRNKYVNILLDCKIRALKQLFREDVYDLTWFYSSFYQGILKELDQYGYKNIIERIIYTLSMESSSGCIFYVLPLLRVCVQN